MTDGRCARAALLAAVLGLSGAVGLPAAADAQSPQPPPQGGETGVVFDIPSQPMAQALNAWAVQANAQLFVDPGPIAHLSAPAVKGRLKPRQALRALIAHTNLEVIQGRDGVFVIKSRATVAATPKARTPTPAAQ